MKRIGVKELTTITNIAVDNKGLLKNNSGKNYYPHTLGASLARESLGCKKMVGSRLAICMEFIDDIWWMVNNGYMIVNPRPYGLKLTYKFNELHNGSKVEQ